ncbi:hypothetical protein L211DRAFT_838726 [Terfezia boudieri ATCC MYA-4762]|uniref:Uncharacterized protein n=1 Tax=Terfezia boudieri ATCC MYA-4762 TaxID=1051890 RepID=A0A3N4LJX6_9PEZI|nr:hypothetical protein L211DRAFT_838726 [Terfezia boudieri ATCC MYA-4762]
MHMINISALASVFPISFLLSHLPSRLPGHQAPILKFAGPSQPSLLSQLQRFWGLQARTSDHPARTSPFDIPSKAITCGEWANIKTEQWC